MGFLRIAVRETQIPVNSFECWQSQSGAYEDIGQHVVKVVWREFQLTVIHVKEYLALKKELS